MTNDIAQRLDIMLAASMITDSDYELLTKLAAVLEERYKLPVDSSAGSMLINHVAMMLGRMGRGDDIPPMSEVAMTSLAQEECYPRSGKLLEELQEHCELTISDNEQQFVRMHLCSLIMKAEGDYHEA